MRDMIRQKVSKKYKLNEEGYYTSEKSSWELWLINFCIRVSRFLVRR